MIDKQNLIIASLISKLKLAKGDNNKTSQTDILDYIKTQIEGV